MTQKSVCPKMASLNSFSPGGQTARLRSIGLQPEAATSSGYTQEMHHRDCWRRRLSNVEMVSHPTRRCRRLRLHNGTPSTFLRCINVLLGLFVCILLIACYHDRRQAGGNGAARPVLSATPNPIPAGDLDNPLGTTTITWDTGNGTPGDLYVKVDREPEKLIASAPSGSNEIRWIQFDSVYEFRLYDEKRSKLLATLTV